MHIHRYTRSWVTEHCSSSHVVVFFLSSDPVLRRTKSPYPTARWSTPYICVMERLPSTPLGEHHREYLSPSVNNPHPLILPLLSEGLLVWVRCFENKKRATCGTSGICYSAATERTPSSPRRRLPPLRRLTRTHLPWRPLGGHEHTERQRWVWVPQERQHISISNTKRNQLQ